MMPVAVMGVLAAQAAVPAAVDPVAIIECRADIAAYQAFAENATSGTPPSGWTKINGGNPLLIEFRLARPITVFGRPASRLAFASSALLAIFDNVEALAIAEPLGVRNDLGSRSKFLGERVISEKVEEDKDAGTRFITRVALNVSTVDTHPGQVLAGCSYRVDVEDL